jgi:hypothetical protein
MNPDGIRARVSGLALCRLSNKETILLHRAQTDTRLRL